MAPPPGSTIVAALDALHSDANAWRTCADQVQICAGMADALSLGGFEFSYAADKAGLQRTYLLLQQKMAHLCEEAATNFVNVATALDSAAYAYDHDERTAVHELHDAW
jgi:hypothetical protein